MSSSWEPRSANGNDYYYVANNNGGDGDGDGHDGDGDGDDGDRGSTATSGATDSGPSHFFLSSINELHPWHAPRDCLSGGLAFPASVAILLRQLAAVRENSVDAMYMRKDKQPSGRGSRYYSYHSGADNNHSGSNHNALFSNSNVSSSSVANSNNFSHFSPDSSGFNSPVLSSAATAAAGGGGGGGGGSGDNSNGGGNGKGNGGGGTVVMRSKRSQRKATDRLGGSTLLDLAKLSTQASTEQSASPSQEHSPLRGSGRGGGGGGGGWSSPENSDRSPPAPLGRLGGLPCVTTTTTATGGDDAVRASSAAGGGGGGGAAAAAAAAPHGSLLAASGSALLRLSTDGTFAGSLDYSSFGSSGGNKRRGELVPITGVSDDSSMPNSSKQRSSPSPRHDRHGLAPLATTNSNGNESGESRNRRGGDGEPSSSSPSPSPSSVVPEIPNFSRFMNDKERLLRQLEEEQRATGLPPPAVLRSRNNSSSSSDRDHDDDDHGSLGVDHSMNNSGLASGDSSPSPPSTMRLTSKLTARPQPANGEDDNHHCGGSGRQGHHGDEEKSELHRDGHDDSGYDDHDHDYGKYNDEEAEEEEDVASSSASEMRVNHPSEANFSAEGHLVCVPGDTLNNRYALISQLGIGRSSRVWLAADLDECSVSRAELIRTYSEERARKLFSPQERPVFVAIKVFRCGEMYSECASYELRMMQHVKDGVDRGAAAGGGGVMANTNANTGGGGGGGSDGALSGRSGRRPRRHSLLESSCLSSEGISPENTARSAAAFLLSARSAGTTSMAMATTTSPPSTVARGLGGDRSSLPRLSLSFTGGSARGGVRGAAVGGPRVGSGGNPANYVATMRDQFTVAGEHGTHHCIVMDVVGGGVDEAINETQLKGIPMDVVRSIMSTSLQGLALLASLHIIHTDIKPENMLFIDMEQKTEEHMRSFKQSRLHPSAKMPLWSASVHPRTSVAQYALQTSRNGSSARDAAEASMVSAAAYSDAINEGSSCDRYSHGQGGGGASFLSPPTSPGIAPGRRRLQLQGGASSEPVSPALPQPPPRTLYEVRVADYGLSYIVPPALRDGLGAMRDLWALHRSTGSGSKKKKNSNGARVTPDGTNHEEPADDDEEEDALDNNEDADGDGRAVLRLDPMVQFELLLCYRQATLAAAQRHLEDEKKQQYQQQQLSATAAAAAAAKPAFFGLGIGGRNENVDDGASLDGSAYDHHNYDAIAAHLRADTTHRYCSPVLGPPPAPPPSLRRHASGVLSLSASSLGGGGGGSGSGGGSGAVGVGVGGRPPGLFLRSGLSALALQSQRPPSGNELSILRDQKYGRGITIQSREYRAPEVMLGGYFLPSCDIWSIGCVAYELVTGSFLFDVTVDYAAAIERRLQQRAEQRRRRRRRPVYSDDEYDEEEDEDEYQDDDDDSCGGGGGYGRNRRGCGARRYSYDEDDDDDGSDAYEDDEEDEWLDADLRNACLYVADDFDKDMDVMHLKSVMKLIGPPPLPLLDLDPCGVYVNDFFDRDGNFKFLECYTLSEDESRDIGMDDIRPFREAEIDHAISTAQQQQQHFNHHHHAHVSSAPCFAEHDQQQQPSIERRLASTMGAGQAIVYHYSDDDDDEFQEELAQTVGGAAVAVVHVHAPIGSGSYGNDEDGNGGKTIELDHDDDEDEEERDDPGTRVSGTATPSSLSPSPAVNYLHTRGGGGDGDNPVDDHPYAPSQQQPLRFARSSSSNARVSRVSGGAPNTANGVSPPRLHAPANGGRAPTDTSNYPICTAAWRRLQETVREHLPSEDEARSFEEFLLLCLQWDPARRATAEELLASRWLTQYGPVASTASLGGTGVDKALC